VRLTPPRVALGPPVPHFNVINGGMHAPNPLDFQEFVIAPPAMGRFRRCGRALRCTARCAACWPGKGTRPGWEDEGGFAPQLAEPQEILALLVSAIDAAGYGVGRDGVAIALDPASSEFYSHDGLYWVAGQKLTIADMIEWYAQIIRRFPACLIEDGLADNGWGGWLGSTDNTARDQA